MEFYYADGDVHRGPAPVADMARLGVRGETLVWRDGMAEWQRADAVPEIRAALAAFTGSTAAVSAPDSGGGFGAQPSATDPYSSASYPQPGYGQPPYGQPQQPAYAPSPYGQPLNYGQGRYGPPSSGMAMTSMILGICAIPVGLVIGCAGIGCAVMAIVLGHMARAKIRRGEAAGAGMALAGLITGYGTIVLTALAVAGLVAIFVIGSQQ